MWPGDANLCCEDTRAALSNFFDAPHYSGEDAAVFLGLISDVNQQAREITDTGTVGIVTAPGRVVRKRPRIELIDQEIW